MDIHSIRADFPILTRSIRGKKLNYLESAATSQKPMQVIEAMSDYLKNHNSNVHRGNHTIANGNGGLVAFSLNNVGHTMDVRCFFAKWLFMWEHFGRGREMPPLNCAIKKTGIKHGKFPLLYFADNARNDNGIIQHNYNGDFNKRFGIPPWKDYKPFDSGRSDDFRFEEVAT